MDTPQHVEPQAKYRGVFFSSHLDLDRHTAVVVTCDNGLTSKGTVDGRRVPPLTTLAVCRSKSKPKAHLMPRCPKCVGPVRKSRATGVRSCRHCGPILSQAAIAAAKSARACHANP